MENEGPSGPDAILVCGQKGPSCFEDNMEGNCEICGREIMWRPHSPQNSVKLCIPCALEEIAGMDEEPEMVVTEATVRDMRKLMEGKDG